MDRAVILAAGRSTRLGGTNKLLVKAGNNLVSEWHRRALEGRHVTAVVGIDDLPDVAGAATWLCGVVGHDKFDGPVGALNAFLWSEPSDEPLLVLFADTLIPGVPDASGDWVGVAPAPWRTWDYHDGQAWTRGVPRVDVCVGLYRFTDLKALRAEADLLMADSAEEVHMFDLLRAYDKHHPLRPVTVPGWQDAGDPEAVRRVVPQGG